MGRLWCAFILQVLSLNEVSSVDFKGKENCYVLKRMLSIVAHLANSYSLINDNPESQDLIASLAAPLGSDNKVKDSAMLSTYLTRNTKGARSLRSWWFSLAKEVRTKRVLPLSEGFSNTAADMDGASFWCLSYFLKLTCFCLHDR